MSKLFVRQFYQAESKRLNLTTELGSGVIVCTLSCPRYFDRRCVWPPLVFLSQAVKDVGAGLVQFWTGQGSVQVDQHTKTNK